MCTTIDLCQFCSNSFELRLARNTMDISHLLLIRLTLKFVCQREFKARGPYGGNRSSVPWCEALP